MELEESDVYEVMDILDSRWRGRGKNRKLEYYVSWMGYGDSYDTWEPQENVADAEELVAEFHRRHPKAAPNDHRGR